MFPRGIYRDIPPFAIGRTAWDNWLIYKARALGLPVIDATEMVTIVHQNHDFAPFPTGEKNDGQGEGKGTEGMRNRELLGGECYTFSLLDATHLLTPAGLKPTLTMSVRYLAHRILRLPEMHPHWIPLMQIIKGPHLLYSSLRSRAKVLKQSMRRRRLPNSL